MIGNKAIAVFLLLTISPTCLLAADISGTWTAEFDTQVGKMNYTYVFEVNETALSGTMTSGNGESAIVDGKVDGDAVSFVENLNYQGMALKIVYTGEIVSVDEINFTRQVGEFATEKLTARRSK